MFSKLFFNLSVMSNSLQLCGLQYARLLWPSLPLRVCSNSYPLSRWCHPTTSSSVIPFFSCSQSFPESLNLLSKWREERNLTVALGAIMVTFSVQYSSVPQSCPTLCTPMDCSTPNLPVHHQLPEFTQIHVDWVGDGIQPSHPLLTPSPPTFNFFQHQGLFKGIRPSHQVAKVLEFQLQHISPSNKYSGLISFRMDWLNLLAVQGNLKSLFQHHSSKASILRHSAFYIVQLSHPYMTTGKNIALIDGPLLVK